MPARDAAAGGPADSGDLAGPGDPAARAAAARSTRRTLALALAVAAVVFLAIVAVSSGRSAPAGGTAGERGADTPPLLSQDDAGGTDPLPAVTLPPLDDLGPPAGVDMSATGGEPVVVNFWASWCAPCVEEMPMLQRVTDELGIRMIGVDYVDQAEGAAALARDLDIRYTLVRDDDGSFGEAVGLLGTPTTLLVDGDGVVRRRLTGALTEEQFRGAIADHLGRG